MGIEPHGFAEPTARLFEVILAEFEIPHGGRGAGVLRVVVEGYAEDGARVVKAAIDHHEVALDRQRLGGRQNLGRKRVFVHEGRRLEPNKVEISLLDIVSEVLLKLRQVAKSPPRRFPRLDVRREKCQEILDRTRVLAEAAHHQQVSQRPGFGIEDRAFRFFVVVGRRVVHGEKRGERQERGAAKKQNVVGARKAEFRLARRDFRIGVKIRRALVEPKRDGGVRPVHQGMRVFVIDRGEGVFTLGVEPQQDVVFFRRANEHAGPLHLALDHPGCGYQRSEGLFVFRGQHNDGQGGVGGLACKRLMKNISHALELAGYVTCLLRVGVRNYGEVGAPNAHPDVGLLTSQGGEDGEERDGREKSSEAHGFTSWCGDESS